tara:strand:- start:2664 stop:3206 length:543 start_codon:yes stop_codon:yes gene_type:complete
MSKGEIHIIMGCMFSGKSSELMRIITKFKLLKKNILAINHIFDTRYGSDKIISHDKREESCLQIEKLTPILETTEYKEAEILIIEEGHFFPDLYEFVSESCKRNKKVYVAGLSGDYKLNPIGEILNLIPICDTVTKLTALCLKCGDGTEAIFSKRLEQNENQILVGSDEYIPVCRHHFHN